MDRDNSGLRFSEGCDGVLDHAFRLGHQYDSGDYYCVLARSDNGLIPGKAKPNGDKCWYPYGGEEHECEDFEWISSNGHGVMIRPTLGEEEEAPQGALKLGSQDDDEYYVVVAHTEEGDVPGKSKNGKCWYSFGGEEKNADHFSYVVVRFGIGGTVPMYDGARIHLESQHEHGGTVRVNEEDEVDGEGGHGSWATYIVQRNEHDGTVRLQNDNKPHRFLAIKKTGLTTGAGGRNCVFRPNFHKNGTVSFMSVNFPGRHIGINDDQTARNPKNTGTGLNARFNILEA